MVDRQIKLLDFKWSCKTEKALQKYLANKLTQKIKLKQAITTCRKYQF